MHLLQFNKNFGTTRPYIRDTPISIVQVIQRMHPVSVLIDPRDPTIIIVSVFRCRNAIRIFIDPWIQRIMRIRTRQNFFIVGSTEAI